MINMADLDCLWYNLMVAFISSIMISLHIGYLVQAQEMDVFSNTTMSAVLDFNNTEAGKRTITKDDSPFFFLHTETQIVVVPDYEKRLTYIITDAIISLTLHNTTPNDAGMYKLKNTDSFGGNDVLFEIKLYIMGRPSPAMITIESNGIVGGQNGSIQCQTSSTSKPSGRNFTYTWTIGSNIIGTENNKYSFKGPGGFTLAIYVDRNESLNEYICSATELNGLTSAPSPSVRLHPNRSPLVRMNPISGVYREIENEQITFQCNVTDGKPTNYTYLWWKNGSILQSTSSMYTISSVKRRDKGRYNCSVYNGIKPNGSDGTSLDILYGPNLTSNTIMSQEDGHNLTLSCNVDSNPEPLDSDITWVRTDNATFNKTGFKLMIPMLNRLDNGSFTCMVNITLLPTDGPSVIKSASTTVNVNVLYGPKINLLYNQSVVEGRKTLIRCNSQSNPSATNDDIIWIKSNNSTFFLKGPELSIPITYRKDNGTFICSVNITLRPTDSPAVVRSAMENVHINVLYGPTITHMASYSQMEGKHVYIKCEIHSNPTATDNEVTWTKEGNTTFSQRGLQLSLQFVNRQDYGTFVCHVSISLQPTDGTSPVIRNNSEAIKINVLYGPVIDPLPNQSLEEGDNITIKCIVQSNPMITDNNVTWRKQGNSSFSQPGIQFNITAVDRMDNGIFVCRVEIELDPSDGPFVLRNKTENLQINVKYQPNITYLSLLTEDIFEGNETIVTCLADGNPLPTISWIYLDNNTAISNSYPTVMSWNNISSQLKISSARCEDTGTYLCKAKNGIVFPTNKTVPINVKCKPRLSSVVSENKNITIGRNESLSYTVMFHAFPIPNFEWSFNGTKLVGFNVSRITDRLPYKSGSMIQKDEITDEDIGLYEIVADNIFGQEKSSFYIIFQREPDQPLLVSHSCIDRPKSARIDWMAGENGGLEQTFTVQYKKETDQHFTDAHENIEEDDTRKVYSKFIDSLVPDLTYIFRVNALNAKGKSFSIEVNCTVQDVINNDDHSATTIIIVISIVSLLSLLGGVGAALLFKSRRQRKTKQNNSQLIKRPHADNSGETEEDGLKDNPMYVSSGPIASKHNNGAIYSVVDKPKQTAQVNEKEGNSELSVYADVVKSNKKGKGNIAAIQKNKKKQKKEKTDTSIEMGCVYENSSDILTIKDNGDVYENSNNIDDMKSKRTYQQTKNKDGLIYADLDLASGPTGTRFVIRGLENRNNYALIDLTKKAEPLPSDSENEDENQSTDNLTDLKNA